MGVERLDYCRAPLGVPPHRWRLFVDDCRRFTASPWAARAARLGWDAGSQPTDKPVVRTEFHGAGHYVIC